MALLEILSSSAVGTALGGLFSWLTRMEERKAQAVKNAHEISMLSMQMQADAEKAKAAVELAKTQGELAAFTESQKTGLVHTGIRLVDAVVGMMRPALTVMLFLMTCWLASKIYRRVDGIEGIPTSDAVDIWRHLVYELVFLTSTAVAWWFGSRPTAIRK